MGASLKSLSWRRRASAKVEKATEVEVRMLAETYAETRDVFEIAGHIYAWLKQEEFEYLSSAQDAPRVLAAWLSRVRLHSHATMQMGGSWSYCSNKMLAN